MAEGTLDPTIAKRMDQTFSDEGERFRHAARRLTEFNDFVAEQSQTGFLQELKQVGTREAAAMQRMDMDRLASSILQQRSVRDQPQITIEKQT